MVASNYLPWNSYYILTGSSASPISNPTAACNSWPFDNELAKALLADLLVRAREAHSCLERRRLGGRPRFESEHAIHEGTYCRRDRLRPGRGNDCSLTGKQESGAPVYVHTHQSARAAIRENSIVQSRQCGSLKEESGMINWLAFRVHQLDRAMVNEGADVWLEEVVYG